MTFNQFARSRLLELQYTQAGTQLLRWCVPPLANGIT